MKKYFLILFALVSVLSAQTLRYGDVKGLFMSVGVGPKFPIGTFGDKNNIGVGFNVTFSYTDNLFLPVFLYTSVGFQHYPGRQDLYKSTSYSSFSSNVLVMSTGIRYYFPPLFENIVLLMPIIDAGLEFGYFENFHQFKIDSNKPNYVEQKGKFGFQAGVGFSMFVLDAITYYNYLPDNQYISFEIKANIPIFINM